MATIKDIQISKNWGARPTGNCENLNEVYYGVEKGQRYDLVQFSINELGKPYYWLQSICVPVDTSQEEIEEIVNEFARDHIKEEDIKYYQRFLEDGEKWGWD